MIAGTSAGASIQASYLTRGSLTSNTIMMAPGHERNFGYVSNGAIDQHVSQRDRENDMAPVIAAHPICSASASMRAPRSSFSTTP
jgi:cyanophycinase